MESKDLLYSEYESLLIDRIPAEYVREASECLSLALEPFDLVVKERSLVIYDKTDDDILAGFFIAKGVEGLTPASMLYYKTILKKFLGSCQLHIKDITTETIRIYLAKLKIAGRTETTMNNERRVLSSFFSWCAAEGHVEYNPMLKIRHIKETKKLKPSFTEEELEKLRFAATSRRDKAIVEFLYSTGCRVSEMCRLNRYDIDFINGECEVLGKGKKYRKVYLSMRCMMLLKEYLESRQDSNEALFVSDYTLWKNDKFKEEKMSSPLRLSKGAIGDLLRKIGKKAEVVNVHPHRFRRTCATMALRRGMPLEQVSKMLGHEDITTTTIYATSTSDEVKNNHQKFVI